jgi:hypothetical protein
MELLSASTLAFMLATPFGSDSLLKQRLSSLDVSEERIGSVVVRSDKSSSGKGSYELSIFSDPEETNLLVKLKRPRFGEIVDVDLHDIDNDGKPELLVAMMDESKGFDDISIDAFELDGDKIAFIDHVLPVEEVIDWIRNKY